MKVGADSGGSPADDCRAGRVAWGRGAIQAPDDGVRMSDKSPRQNMTKKTSKSIKEKRADKRAKEHPASVSEQMHTKKK
jgi:hypothetical protein